MASFADGVGAAARFNRPCGVVVTIEGNIYVADTLNRCLRQVPAGGRRVSTLADSRESGSADGPGNAASLGAPLGLAMNTQGLLVVADGENHSIHKVTTEGWVSTVAGGNEDGLPDGVAGAARLCMPCAVTVDGSINILVADFRNHRIRMIAAADARVTTVAGTNKAGTSDGAGARASFSFPRSVIIDEHGQLLVLQDNIGGKVRVVEASLVPPARLAAADAHAVRPVLEGYSHLVEVGDTGKQSFTRRLEFCFCKSRVIR